MDHPFDEFAASYGPIKAVAQDGSGTFYLGASAANYVSLVANVNDAAKCMPIFTALTERSENTASICAAMMCGGTSWIAVTPCVLCAVTAVTMEAP